MKKLTTNRINPGIRCDIDDTMRRITKIEGGWWVRFIKNNKAVLHKQFYVSRYGSEERALTNAKIWRNEQERKRLTTGELLNNWNETCAFHIVGISWVQAMSKGRFTDIAKAYCSKPAIGCGKTVSFSITKHGVSGALELAINSLEKMKSIKYPEKVKKKAHVLFAREYKKFSIAHIK